MRVAIVSVADLRNMTCANYYCGLLEENNIPFDIICTNRYEEAAHCSFACGLYQFDMVFPFSSSKLTKLRCFLRYKTYVKQLLEANRYDFLIIWGENALVLLGGILNSFRGRFCYNKRDSFEGALRIFIPYEKRAMRHALFSTIPSPAGISSLSGESYVLTNYDYLTIRQFSHEKRLRLRNDSEVIRITYMGLISSYLEAFKRFVVAFGNDERFLIAFYGESADTELRQFAESRGITNVVFGGAFSPEMTASYLMETDIINSVYGGVISESQSKAVGVKASYSPLLHIPVLSDKGTYWASVSEDYGFGLGLDCDYSDAPNIVFNWYHSLKQEEFDLGCEKYVDTRYEGNKEVRKRLLRFLQVEERGNEQATNC